jgi:hypothetical protein
VPQASVSARVSWRYSPRCLCPLRSHYREAYWRFKRLAGYLPDLQAETPQDSPNAQFHI